MAEAKRVTLKSFFSAALVRRLGADIARVHPNFPERAFVNDASTGLRSLELLDCGKHIAAALGRHLPSAYPDAIAVLRRSLGPELATDELVGVGMAPFFYLPHSTFIAERGLENFDLSMRAQYELTKRFSAEWSIRAFIAKDPERTLAVLHEWTKDPNAHVRRLVSEGTRLRLPWARRVGWLDANPKRVAELLELLKDDPSRMVRRSVANGLNDVAKDYPDLVVEVCTRWSAEAAPERQWIVRQALRSLVKRGHRGALATLGVEGTPAVRINRPRLTPTSVEVGGELRFSFVLTSFANCHQDLVVDYAVHFVKANGTLRPKVFKLKQLTLGPAESVKLQSTVSFRPMTTRRHYAGRHRIELVVNGTVYPLGAFDVRA